MELIMNNEMVRLDVLLRTWVPSEKQNEIRQAINALLISRPAPPSPVTEEKDAEVEAQRLPNHAVDCLLNLVLCDDKARYTEQARRWLETHGYLQNGEPTKKAHSKRRATVPAIEAEPLDAELAEAQRLYELTTQGEWGSSIVTEHDGSLRNALVGLLGGGRIAKLSPIRAEPPTPHGGFRLTLSMYEQQAKSDAAWIAAAHNLWPRLVARAQGADAVWNEAIRVVKEQAFRWRNTVEIVKALEAARDKQRVTSDETPH